MASLVYKGLGLIRHHFSLNTTIDNDEVIPFLSKLEDLEYANGLAFVDKEGIRAGRRAGWIMSLQTLWKYFDEEEYYLMIQTTEQITKTLNKFAVGVLSCHHNRTGQVPKNFHSTSEAERFQTGKVLLSQLINDIVNKHKILEVFKMFEANGFAVCDQRRNDVAQYTIASKHKEAKDYINRIATETNIVVPIILSSLSLQKLSRTHDLLELEATQGHKSVIYQPDVLTSTQHEKSDLRENINKVFEDLSSLNLDQSMLANHLEVYQEMALESGQDTRELEEIRSSICRAVKTTLSLTGDIDNLKSDYLTFVELADEVNRTKNFEVNNLRQVAHENEQELAVSKLAIDSLESKVKELLQAEEENELARCENEAKLRELKVKLDRQRRDKQVKTGLLQEMNNEIKEVEKKFIASNQKRKDLESQIRQHKLEQTNINEKYDSSLAHVKDQNNKIKNLEGNIQKVKREYQTTQDELKLLDSSLFKEKQQTKRLERMLRKSLSIDKATQITPIKTPIKATDITYKRLKMDEVFLNTDSEDSEDDDESNKQYLIDISTVSIPAKDVQAMLGKQKFETEELHVYLDHLETCKTMLCDDGISVGQNQTGKISEAQFMKYMRLRLPTHIKHIYDRLDDTVKKDMQKTKTAILEALDMDPSEYLTQFNTTTIKPNESYTSYAYRIIRLYLQGHNLPQDTSLTHRDQETIIQQFLSGIDQTGANTLRLVADSSEIKDILKLAKRAQKLRRHKGKTDPPSHDGSQEIQAMSQNKTDFENVTKDMEKVTLTDSTETNQSRNNKQKYDNTNNRSQNGNWRNNNKTNYSSNKYGNNRNQNDDINSNWRQSNYSKNNNTNTYSRPNYNNNNNYTKRFNSSQNNNWRQNYNNQGYPNQYQNRNYSNGNNYSRPNYNNQPRNNEKYQRTNFTDNKTAWTNQKLSGNDRKPGNCNYCKKPGHWWQECRNRLADERNKISNQVTNIFHSQQFKRRNNNNSSNIEKNYNVHHIKNNMNKFVLTNKSVGKHHQPQIYATIIDPNRN